MSDKVPRNIFPHLAAYGLRVRVLEFRVQGAGCRVQGSGCRVCGAPSTLHSPVHGTKKAIACLVVPQKLHRGRVVS